MKKRISLAIRNYKEYKHFHFFKGYQVFLSQPWNSLGDCFTVKAFNKVNPIKLEILKSEFSEDFRIYNPFNDNLFYEDEIEFLKFFE